MRTVHFVVPESIDDPGRPSGGNIYDREVARDLREFGWTVREHLVGRSLRDVLRALPRGATVAVDGLLGCADAAAVHEAAQRVRVVLLVHMPAGLEGGERADVAVETERAALSAAHAVIATSNWTRGLLIARHGATAERVRVAEPGVESAPLSAGTSAGGQLLYVGAVARHKGLDVLVRALAEVADLAWECVCVGSLDREPGYAAVVRLVGAAERDVVAKYYAAADLLVVPSRVEAYGMVVSEALARGLPVVASEAGGIAEAMGATAHGQPPGMLARPGDARALADALRDWLTDEALRQRLRQAAAQRRERLRGWHATAGRVSDVLTETAHR